MESQFERHYTLEEAAAMIPEVRESLAHAHKELLAIRDEIILYKRFQLNREQHGDELNELEEEVLKQKWLAYEETFNRWIEVFAEKGIILRDLDRGLIDFPYHSKSGEEYLLCWQLGEDGLFYFHDLQEGFPGRKPITLLPD